MIYCVRWKVNYFCYRKLVQNETETFFDDSSLCVTPTAIIVISAAATGGSEKHFQRSDNCRPPFPLRQTDGVTLLMYVINNEFDDDARTRKLERLLLSDKL